MTSKMSKFVYYFLRVQIFLKYAWEEEKIEFADIVKTMWSESFGALDYTYPTRILIGVGVFICSVGYACVLFLWFIAYPAILMLFLWLMLMWCIFMLDQINHFWRLDDEIEKGTVWLVERVKRIWLHLHYDAQKEQERILGDEVKSEERWDI